jgi:hypothetical protein
MHEALHGDMTRHYATWMWVLNNGLTGAAYVYIGSLILRGWPVQARFGGLFATFIAACGLHHIVHAVPGVFELPHGLISSVQEIVDFGMTSVSCLTAVLAGMDYRDPMAEWRRGRRTGQLWAAILLFFKRAEHA